MSGMLVWDPSARLLVLVAYALNEQGCDDDLFIPVVSECRVTTPKIRTDFKLILVYVCLTVQMREAIAMAWLALAV